MTVKKKRTLASIITAAIATMSLTVVTASAETTFNFYHLNIGDDQYTAAVEKTNSLQYATISVDGGSFVNSDRLFFRVCENEMAGDGVYYFATETKQVNGPYNFSLDYTEAPGVYGDYYRLRGYLGVHSELNALDAWGTWTP